MKIGYVCTNFNNSSFTIGAATTLLRNAGHQSSIVVVDNCSDDSNKATLRELAAAQPAVKVIFSPENLGYFRGLNLGIRYLRERDASIEWYVIGNNDLEFPQDFGDKLEANVPRWRDHSVVSPDIVTLDGSHQNPHVIAKISKFREFVYDVYFSNYYIGMLAQKLAMQFRRVSDRSDEEQWEIAQPIYQGHGSCYLLGPNFFERFSELWAPTFLMSEEFFLAKQLMDVGQKVYYDPAVRVIHHWHGSLAGLPNRRRWELSRVAHREYRKHVKLFE
jgi:GT2 family glycosyltransferase